MLIFARYKKRKRITKGRNLPDLLVLKTKPDIRKKPRITDEAPPMNVAIV